MINDLGDLKKLFKLCRDNGVLEIKLQGVELKLSDVPRETLPDVDINQEIAKAVGMDPEFPDVDPMAFYSQPRAEQ